MFKVLAFCIFLGSALANYDYDFAHYYEYVYPDQTKTAPVAQLPPVYMYYSQSVPVPQQMQQISDAAPRVFAEQAPAHPAVFNEQGQRVFAEQAPRVFAEQPPAVFAEQGQRVFAEQGPLIQVFNKEAPAPKEIQKEEPAVQSQELKQESPAPQAAPKEEQESLPIKKESAESQEQQQEISAQLKQSPKVYLDYYAKPKYLFKYEVDDCHTGDKKSHQEERDGDKTKGQYTVHQPDGTILTVDYSVIGKSGYNAVVKRIGKPIYPQPEIKQKPKFTHVLVR